MVGEPSASSTATSHLGPSHSNDVGNVPPALTAYIVRDRVAPIEVELEAYQTGSKELLLQLILMDPHTKSEGQACRLLDDILALPFHEDMRQHYR